MSMFILTEVTFMQQFTKNVRLKTVPYYRSSVCYRIDASSNDNQF